MDRHFPPQPGAVVLHKDGTPYVISDRKRDKTGWWLTDGSGLSDRALNGPEWVVVDRASLRDLFADVLAATS